MCPTANHFGLAVIFIPIYNIKGNTTSIIAKIYSLPYQREVGGIVNISGGLPPLQATS